MGIMFGPAAFLWIVIGTIFGGAVHDYMSGMLSVREKGASLPEIVGNELGGTVKNIMRLFSLLLLILVGAVFVYNPADLLAMLTPNSLDRIFWVIVIFGYFIATTLPSPPSWSSTSSTGRATCILCSFTTLNSLATAILSPSPAPWDASSERYSCSATS